MEMAYNPKVVSIVLFAIWALSITIIFLPRKFQKFQLFYWFPSLSFFNVLLFVLFIYVVLSLTE